MNNLLVCLSVVAVGYVALLPLACCVAGREEEGVAPLSYAALPRVMRRKEGSGKGKKSIMQTLLKSLFFFLFKRDKYKDGCCDE